MMFNKILHLCADLGSDSYFYQQDPKFEVIKIGKSIGVENFTTKDKIFGVIANPPCTEFSAARSYGKARLGKDGFEPLNHCLRIIKELDRFFKVPPKESE